MPDWNDGKQEGGGTVRVELNEPNLQEPWWKRFTLGRRCRACFGP